MARRLFSESPGRRVLMIFLVYCIVSLFYYVSVVSWPTTNMARYSLFVSESAVKHQANKQTKLSHEKNSYIIILLVGPNRVCHCHCRRCPRLFFANVTDISHQPHISVDCRPFFRVSCNK